MDPRFERDWLMTRRAFFRGSGTGIGFAALATLLGNDLMAAPAGSEAIGGLAGFPNFAPKAKRVILLNQTGAPSQLDLWDYKPLLAEMSGEELPESARKNLKQTGMTSTQFTLPVIGSKFKFTQHGQTGTWVSELLPHTAKIVERHLPHQGDVDRSGQSRSRDQQAAYRLSSVGPAPARRVGVLCAGQ